MVMETMRSLMNVLINEIGSGKHNPLGDQIKVTTKLKKTYTFDKVCSQQDAD